MCASAQKSAALMSLIGRPRNQGRAREGISTPRGTQLRRMSCKAPVPSKSATGAAQAKALETPRAREARKAGKASDRSSGKKLTQRHARRDLDLRELVATNAEVCVTLEVHLVRIVRDMAERNKVLSFTLGDGKERALLIT
jgi:hypothetical protein